MCSSLLRANGTTATVMVVMKILLSVGSRTSDKLSMLLAWSELVPWLLMMPIPSCWLVMFWHALIRSWITDFCQGKLSPRKFMPPCPDLGLDKLNKRNINRVNLPSSWEFDFYELQISVVWKVIVYQSTSRMWPLVTGYLLHGDTGCLKVLIGIA